ASRCSAIWPRRWRSPTPAPSPTRRRCSRTCLPHKELAMREITFAQALEEAIVEEMRRDERVITFGTTRNAGLELEFGASRVRFTPISEATMTGMGLGAAGSGYRPVVNWGMVTFAFVAMDQIVN